MNKKILIIANFLITNRHKSGPDYLQLSRSDSRWAARLLNSVDVNSNGKWS